ncbi:ABC-type antimicrobial peptide transport system, ATPase component [Opitutaceae bacterium TAV1]|nr:ATP-binding protein [Opitutaceae bacterium TAV5]EIP96564.1 ABC-type antimicrobial peptide transport system, ATPase component [Opitutaceae bacterium TAV1]
MPILTAENLHRTLGEGEARAHALRGVSLAIEPGRTCAISGHSGSGKSTLLYLLGLLDLPDEGTIVVNGRLTSGLTDAERTALRNEHMGFVFQFHFLLKEFSALENVMLPMRKLGRLDERTMRDKAAGLLARVGLADKTARLGNQLSGGEQQRVAIARALANDPVLLLADEPTGNLDQQNAGKVFDLLAELTHTRGNALVMVSHNPELASRCDHIFHMKDGLIDRGA